MIVHKKTIVDRNDLISFKHRKDWTCINIQFPWKLKVKNNKYVIDYIELLRFINALFLNIVLLAIELSNYIIITLTTSSERMLDKLHLQINLHIFCLILIYHTVWILNYIMRNCICYCRLWYHRTWTVTCCHYYLEIKT